MCLYIKNVIDELLEETGDCDTCSENSSSTKDMAAEIEVQVASGHMLTSSKVNPIPFIQA